MHFITNIIFSINVKNISKHFIKQSFSLSPKLFFKNEKHLHSINSFNAFNAFNTHFINKRDNVQLIHKRKCSKQSLIDSISNAKNKLDRASLYLLEESIQNNYKFLNEEKKEKCKNIINELAVLLNDKTNLKEEKMKILTEKSSKKYSNKEILALFITGFFFTFASATHPIFYLVSVYGLYALYEASKENNNIVYIQMQLNENKKKLLINEKYIKNLLNILEQDLIKLKNE
ncbi:conserved protein, unknown function [Hepatocystis sp. ex Piliocolobus tephrosceles]|nr:conserved protein, unknown function [Hepatocystis sp. ex Piliocolobus tephrosceles]